MKKQAPTRKSKKNPLESEAAIKRAIKKWSLKFHAVCQFDEPIITVFDASDNAVARLDLRTFVKKRRALTGVTKRLRKAVR